MRDAHRNTDPGPTLVLAKNNSPTTDKRGHHGPVFFNMNVNRRFSALVVILMATTPAIAQILATQGAVSVTVDDIRAAAVGYDDKSENAKFSTMAIAKDSISALLVTKHFALDGDRLLAPTERERKFLSFATERNKLDAALALIERREREKAANNPGGINARAREFYATRPDGFKVPTKVKVAHILFRADGKRSLSELTRLADEVSKQARQGVPWQTLVDAYSDDAKSRDKGGEVGDFYENSSDHPMVVGAFRSPLVNQVSEPVVSRSGIHVVKVLKREEARRATFEEVEEKLIDAVIQERVSTAKQDYLAKLDRAEKVTFFEERISPFVSKVEPLNEEKIKQALGSQQPSDFAAPTNLPVAPKR